MDPEYSGVGLLELPQLHVNDNFLKKFSIKITGSKICNNFVYSCIISKQIMLNFEENFKLSIPFVVEKLKFSFN